MYESEIESLKVRTMSAMSCNVNNDDYNLIIDTNKRLKEQFDSITSELNETNEKLKAIEDEYHRIKSEKCGLEIDNETYLGAKFDMHM